MAGQSNLQPGSRAGPGPFRGACRDCLAGPRAPREAWALQRPPAGGSGQAFEPARARSRARGRPEGGSEGLGSLGSAACRPVTDAGRLGGVLRHPSPAPVLGRAAARAAGGSGRMGRRAGDSEPAAERRRPRLGRHRRQARDLECGPRPGLQVRAGHAACSDSDSGTRNSVAAVIDRQRRPGRRGLRVPVQIPGRGRPGVCMGTR